jgi:hypothetical protein
MSAFIGKEIKPADNLDVFDTIAPLWENKANLSETERALVYAIAVLRRQIANLEQQLQTPKLTGGARKNNSLRKKSSKTNKSIKSTKKSSKSSKK